MKNCRGCGHPLEQPLCDLGETPLANSYLESEAKQAPSYPLCPYVCEKCYLVQLSETISPDELFSDYAYFSSFSDSWLKHAKDYADETADRFDLGGNSKVVEIASNDGYLLQYFKGLGINVLGIEPAKNIAVVAEEKGIPTRPVFFGEETAKSLQNEGETADLLIGNNVLAHVPDLHDFVEGLKVLLKPEGIITLEFPHLLQLMRENQFDTIYHEHVFYFSLLALEPIFEKHGLKLFDVRALPTHGGSLRVYLKHAEDLSKSVSSSVEAMKQEEREFGLDRMETYRSFAESVATIKRELLQFLEKAKAEGKKVVGYGAPAKGNTLLNYCGIGPDLISYTVDRSPHKQGLELPGSRIPIYAPERITQDKPDYVIILPWNLKTEITRQMEDVSSWGGRFFVPIPSPQVIK